TVAQSPGTFDPAEFVFQVPTGHAQWPIELPHIARYLQLPHRMNHEPRLPKDEVGADMFETQDPAYYDRLLRESTTDEITAASALSLARMAREASVDITACTDVLVNHLQQSDRRDVRLACLLALVEGDCRRSEGELARLASTSDEELRALADAGLSRWKTLAAVPAWIERVQADASSNRSFRDACRGLIATGDASQLTYLAQYLFDATKPFVRRAAAASVIGQLEPSLARKTAAQLRSGGVPERLLATECLQSEDPDSLNQLAEFCNDQAAAVAAVAWKFLQPRGAERLKPYLQSGYRHQDAGVRMAAAETLAIVGGQENRAALSELTADVHIEVRNLARELLLKLGQESEAVRTEIVGTAVELLQSKQANWQSLEQNLVLLAQLRSAESCPVAVPLLRHSRSEVMVTSAWLLHLYPDAVIADDALSVIPEQHQRLQTDNLIDGQNHEDVGMQLSFLFQLAGLLQIRDYRSEMEVSFSKGVPGGLMMREGAMWSLGLSHFNSEDAALGRKMESRLKDRDSLIPEADSVRQKSALGLGFLKAAVALPALREAFEIDGTATMIPSSAWVLFPRLGAEQPPLAKLTSANTRIVRGLNPQAIRDE
ncbi:MAG: HEAT repeat domain-containing protein, partial [Planctomycetaceae bacterium]|nr:HEAT repeat domain-containing protein [Planctomycetaceae bacterium]